MSTRKTYWTATTTPNGNQTREFTPASAVCCCWGHICLMTMWASFQLIWTSLKQLFVASQTQPVISCLVSVQLMVKSTVATVALYPAAAQHVAVTVLVSCRCLPTGFISREEINAVRNACLTPGRCTASTGSTTLNSAFDTSFYTGDLLLTQAARAALWHQRSPSNSTACVDAGQLVAVVWRLNQHGHSTAHSNGQQREAEVQ
jgi:hypothetical protein